MKLLIILLQAWIGTANSDPFSDKYVLIYEGELHPITGQPLGEGKVTYKNGDVYEGAMEGVPHG